MPLREDQLEQWDRYVSWHNGEEVPPQTYVSTWSGWTDVVQGIDDELRRLRAIETAAQALATAADALLDVTVASTPNTRLSSVAKQIGALHRAWKEYRDAT